MGADVLCQPPSDAALWTVQRWLTWENVPEQQACSTPYSVRIEGVRGSNPLSSTQNRRSEACIDVFVITAKIA